MMLVSYHTEPESMFVTTQLPSGLRRVMLVRGMITGGKFFGFISLNHITAPICQGTNSTSPKPSSSLLLGVPDATLIINSKISLPFS